MDDSAPMVRASRRRRSGRAPLAAAALLSCVVLTTDGAADPPGGWYRVQTEGGRRALLVDLDSRRVWTEGACDSPLAIQTLTRGGPEAWSIELVHRLDADFLGRSRVVEERIRLDVRGEGGKLRAATSLSATKVIRKVRVEALDRPPCS